MKQTFAKRYFGSMWFDGLIGMLALSGVIAFMDILIITTTSYPTQEEFYLIKGLTYSIPIIPLAYIIISAIIFYICVFFRAMKCGLK